MSRAQELLAVALLAGGIFVLTDGQPLGSTSKPGAGSGTNAAPYSEPTSTRPHEHRQMHRGVPPAVRKAARCKRQPSPTAQSVAPTVKEAKKHERPKVKVKPKPQRTSALPQRTAALPSCAMVRREYERMNHGQRMAAYLRATPEQVAHGRRCLQI